MEICRKDLIKIRKTILKKIYKKIPIKVYKKTHKERRKETGTHQNPLTSKIDFVQS